MAATKALTPCFISRGCAKPALNPSSAFVPFDFGSAKRIPLTLAISGKDYLSWGPLSLFKTSGLWSFALPLNKAVSVGFENVDADGGFSATGEISKKLDSPKCAIDYHFESVLIDWRMTEAVKKLKLARSKAKKALKRVKEEEACLQEAEKLSEAAQAAVKNPEIVGFLVLNLLSAQGQDLNDDFCAMATAEARKQLVLAHSNANVASLRVQTAKASLMRAEENAKAAQDDVVKSEEEAFRVIKSMIECVNSGFKAFIDSSLEQMRETTSPTTPPPGRR